MANGNFDPLEGLTGLQRFSVGFNDPSFVARARLGRSQRQSQARVAAAQAALASLPGNHPARERAQTILDEEGFGDIGQFIQPQQPQAEQFTLRPNETRFEQFPGGTGRVVARGPQTEGAQDPAFGKSQSSLAMQSVLRARAKQRQGIPLTPEDRDQLSFARGILTAPRIIQGPGGSLIQAEPIGVPEQLESVFDEVPNNLGRTSGGTQIESLGQQERSGQFKITTLKKSTDFDKDFDVVLSISDEVAKLLIAGRQEIGGITGAVGTAKAAVGGVARQLGIPVSGRSKTLKRKLEALKAIAAPHVLGESGRSLSNEDRARLDRIVGTLDALSDEQDIREAVIALIELMQKMKQ